jgi:hypothetical protein
MDKAKIKSETQSGRGGDSQIAANLDSSVWKYSPVKYETIRI